MTLTFGEKTVVDTSDQNEVRICYHRNCVTFDFHHQISLVEDLVFQLTGALQLNGEQLVVIGSILLYFEDELVNVHANGV